MLKAAEQSYLADATKHFEKFAMETIQACKVCHKQAIDTRNEADPRLTRTWVEEKASLWSAAILISVHCVLCPLEH